MKIIEITFFRDINPIGNIEEFSFVNPLTIQFGSTWFKFFTEKPPQDVCVPIKDIAYITIKDQIDE